MEHVKRNLLYGDPEEAARLRAEHQVAYDKWRAAEEAKEEAAQDAADPRRIEERRLRATLLDLTRKAFPLYPIEDTCIESDRVISDAVGSRTYFRFYISLEASPREFPSDAFDWYQGAVMYVTVPGETADDNRRVVYSNAPKLNARKRHPGWDTGVDPDPERSARMRL